VVQMITDMSASEVITDGHGGSGLTPLDSAKNRPGPNGTPTPKINLSYVALFLGAAQASNQRREV